MMTPIVSTRLAMKGVELVAGSIPRRFMSTGSIDPMVQPDAMMQSTVMPTVSANRNVWSGYIITRPIAMTAMMMPSKTPMTDSRTRMRHQSVSLISPSASPRMTSVDDWDPELPPAEMSSGT